MKRQAAGFRAVVPGIKESIKYESPVGGASFDHVEGVSGEMPEITP